MAKATRPTDLLEPRPSKSHIVKLVLAALVFVFLTLSYIFVENGYNIQAVVEFFTRKENRIYFLTAVIGVLSSYIGSILFSISEDRYHRSRLDYIISLADNNYLASIVSDLEFYRGRFYKDYNIALKFSKLNGHDDIIVLNRRDSYGKKLVSNNLYFRIMRIRNDDNVKEYLELKSKLSDVYDTHETFQTIDERSIPATTRESEEYEKAFCISSVVIERTESLRLGKVSQDDLYLNGYIAKNIDLSSHVHIEVDLSWPMETDSFYSIILEFPCKGLSISVDYSEVGDLVEMNIEDYLSSRVGAPVSYTDGKGIKNISHGGWQPAKSNVVLTWWRK